MKPRGLVVLAIVAIAMAAIIAIERGRHGGGDGPTSARTRLLPPFDRQAVKRVTIARKDGTFSLLHSPSPSAPPPAPGWQLGVAGAPAADDAAVQDLLSALDLAESDRTPPLPPEQAGLVPPTAAIDVETPTGTLALQLGSVDATGQGVYARAGAGAPIRVIGRRVLDLVDRDPAAFRDRRLLPLDPEAVTAIAWRDETGPGEVRAVDGRWQNGRNEWVASERVVESLRRLLALRIDRFEAAVAGKPAGRRTLAVTAGPATVAVKTAEDGKDGALTRGDERVFVPADAFESAWRSLAAAAARDERLISLPPDTVMRIDLHDARGRVGLRRAGGAWTFSPPAPPYPADTRAVDEWLARLGTVKATTRSGGANVRHLTVEGRFRQQVDVSSPADVHALLAPDPLRFRAREVLSFARFDVRRLQRSVGRNTQLLTTQDGGSWLASAGEPDAANAALVVGALSDLRAAEFVAAPPAGEPTVRLEIDVQPPGEPRPTRHIVQLYTRPNDCIARLDEDTTFRLERATCATLRLDLLQK
jgi:hypothetical protein